MERESISVSLDVRKRREVYLEAQVITGSILWLKYVDKQALSIRDGRGQITEIALKERDDGLTEYRIYSNKRRGAYLIFRAASATLI